MITVRRAQDRGHFDFGWLDTNHTFSFGEYYDPRFMGFRDLRVINEDRVSAGHGFPKHAHRDMEIISYVLEGSLEHQDSLGNGSVIRPGDVQRMSAGTGVTHSERNHSQTERVHFMQIWIMPNQEGIAPSYEQKTYRDEDKQGKLCLVASSDGRDGSVTVHQDVKLYAALLDPAQRETIYQLQPERHAWIQIMRGSLEVNGELLGQSDGAAISREEKLALVCKERAEVLLFDLA